MGPLGAGLEGGTGPTSRFSRTSTTSSPLSMRRAHFKILLYPSAAYPRPAFYPFAAYPRPVLLFPSAAGLRHTFPAVLLTKI